MEARRTVAGIALAILLLAAISCSTTPTGQHPSVPVELQINFKPSLLTTLIDTIRLRVSYPLTGETIDELPSFEQGIILDTLVLPPGDSVEFCLHAISGQGQLLYKGCSTVNIVVGGSTVVPITMEPAVSMLRPSPIYYQLMTGEEVAIGIDLYNITDLYAVAFRLHFNNDVLAVKSIEPGSFLEENILFTPNIQPAYVAVGVTRLPPDLDGVDESGRLATVVFEAVGTGESVLEFDAGRLTLINRAGHPIPEAANMIVETGEIAVRRPGD